MTTKRVGRMMEADARKWGTGAGTHPAQKLNQLSGMLRPREYARPEHITSNLMQNLLALKDTRASRRRLQLVHVFA
jgi:hypothetical protein